MEGSEQPLGWEHPKVQMEIWGQLSDEISHMIELFGCNRHDDIKVGIIRNIREICAGKIIPGKIPQDDQLFSRVRDHSIEVAYVLLGKAEAPEDQARDFHARALDIKNEELSHDSVREELFNEASQALATVGMFVHQGDQGIDPVLWQKFTEVHVSILSRMLDAVRHDLTRRNPKGGEQGWKQAVIFRDSMACDLPISVQEFFDELSTNFRQAERAHHWSISGVFRTAVARLMALINREP